MYNQILTLSKSVHFSQSSLSQPWKREGTTNEIIEENKRARKAYESVLTVTASSSSGSNEYESFQKAVKQLSKEKFDYNYDEPVNNFVANFHDAVRKLLMRIYRSYVKVTRK